MIKTLLLTIALSSATSTSTLRCHGQSATVTMWNYGHAATITACTADFHYTKKQLTLVTLDGIFKGGFER